MDLHHVVFVAMLLIGGFHDGVQQNTDDNTVTDDNDKESHCPDKENDDNEEDGVACRTHNDCGSIGQKCCGKFGKKKCVKRNKAGQKQYHAPFLGLIPRECPQEPIPEPFAIRNCSTDRDCWPRLCCPDGETSYCRIALPLWDQLPARRLFTPLRNMLAYMQCTPPPPPLYDLFPKPCRSTIDCFPNLCCQERDKRVCRPPKRSLLVLLATLGQFITGIEGTFSKKEPMGYGFTKQVMALLAGHDHFWKHLPTLQIINIDPVCRLCKQSEETTKHIDVVYVRFEARKRAIFGALQAGDVTDVTNGKEEMLDGLVDIHGYFID